MKSARFFLLGLLASACIPSSGSSGPQAAVLAPDPMLAGTASPSPFVTRPATQQSAEAAAATPVSAQRKKKVWPWIIAGAAAVVLVVVLVSGGSSYGGGGY